MFSHVELCHERKLGLDLDIIIMPVNRGSGLALHRIIVYC